MAPVNFNKIGYGNGAYAEEIIIPEDCLMKIPDQVSFIEAASIPLVGATCLEAWRKLKYPKNSKKILVLGASGGVGSFMVSFLAAQGVDVFGVCSAKNMKYVQNLGACKVYDYNNEPLNQQIKDTKFDGIFDAVGGDEYYHQCKTKMKIDSFYVTVVGPFKHAGNVRVSFKDFIHMGYTLFKRRFIQTRFKYKMVIKPKIQRDASLLESYIAQNPQQKTNITEFPIEEFQEAFKQSQTHKTRGKLVLTF